VDIAAWLQSLGLERYEAAFRDHEIDWEALPKLTVEDLTDLGVVLGGHRRKLLKAIAASRSSLPSPPSLAHEGGAGAVAERRQLTVMFCDLVGSTELASRLDPEDLREVITAYHRAVADVARSLDGFVAKYMGDGVLVYFGYPSAHENDAEHAVRAGLGIVAAVGRLDIGSVKLQARVGIATGLVVVGDLIGAGSAQEQSVVGETPNLAARLQALAEPDAVVIAAGTRRLVGDLFEYRNLGDVEVKGIAEPVPAWQVLRPGVVVSRFEALRGSALGSMIGRDEEIDLLLRRWERAKTGEGQVVLVSGEPGLGKSRITAVLEERLQIEPHLRLRYFCSPYRQDSALFPFIDQMGRVAGLAPTDTPAVKLKKLEVLLTRRSLPEEDAAFLADLLSLPAPAHHPLANLSPQRKKQRTLEALIRGLEDLARQPVLMIVEDAHWIDPTSRELLDLSVGRLRSLPVLLLITFRPEFEAPWIGQPHVTVLVLNRLDRRSRTDLVTQIAGKPLPADVISQIIERTDGVPLFIEELTKSVLESGLLRDENGHYVLDRPLPPLAIPTSLHASLTARLDRLGPVRHVAQIGAAFGRWFRYSLLRTVSGLAEDELHAALNRLVASELVFQTGTPPDAVYTFKHALVQEAAYSSLLRNTRQQLHARIAEALEIHFPELIDSQPELFARHYAEAGITEKSVSYWRNAARRSAARSAMAEAAAQFQRALDQLALLPESLERQRQELECHSSLGVASRFVKGLAAEETGRAFARARELWEQLDFPSEFLQVPYWQSLHHQNRGEFELARSLDEDLLHLSRQRGDSSGLVLGNLCSGRNRMLAGNFPTSRSHLDAALALYDANSHGSLANQTGTDLEVASLGWLGLVLFCLGFPEQALARSSEAVDKARQLAHLPSLATSLSIGTRVLSLIGDHAVLDKWAVELVAVATEHGFPHWRGEGTAFRGWVEVECGDLAEGISLLRSGIAAYRSTGAEVYVCHCIGLLASAYEIAEQFEEASALLDDALQIVKRTGESWFAAELYRHKGQLLLRKGYSEAAEKFYRKALRIARQQGANLWELRAAMSLARLRRDQGRQTDARDLLAPIYDWFTEGFDTPDLKKAKTLLEELGR
jgi:class 3 adenylate cyclase/predicted ATPase